MAKTKEQYEFGSDWRKAPRTAFWRALKSTSPDAFGKLDDIAKSWLEAAHHGGGVPPEMVSARQAWQRVHGLDVPWLAKLADEHLLAAKPREAGAGVIPTPGLEAYGVVGYPPPIPPSEIGRSPGEYAKRSKEHYRNVVAPHWGLSRVQTIETPYHLEWVVLYQCNRMSYTAIATMYAPKLKRENLDESSVRDAVRDAADVLQLPLRKAPRGRPRKTA